MFHLDDITTKNNDKVWPLRLIVIGPSGSSKANYLINKIQTGKISLTRFICMQKT